MVTACSHYPVHTNDNRSLFSFPHESTNKLKDKLIAWVRIHACKIQTHERQVRACHFETEPLASVSILSTVNYNLHCRKWIQMAVPEVNMEQVAEDTKTPQPHSFILIQNSLPPSLKYSTYSSSLLWLLYLCVCVLYRLPLCCCHVAGSSLSMINCFSTDLYG